MKTIVIPFGFSKKEVTEDETRELQKENLLCEKISPKGRELLDAILSYFIKKCMI